MENMIYLPQQKRMRLDLHFTIPFKLEKAMREIEYQIIGSVEHILPNGRKLVRIDFKR